MGPMESATWKIWSEIHPNDGDIYYAIQACLGVWLILLGPTDSPNSPNGGFNPTPPPAPPTPIRCHQCVSYLAESYKTLADHEIVPVIQYI